MAETNVRLAILHGTAHAALARAVATELHTDLHQVDVTVFPDGELDVCIRESVRGMDAYVVQPTCQPVERNLLEILLIADACRRAGVRSLTAAVPYFGYARQDRRTHGRRAVGARLVLDLLASAHVDRIVSVDVHTPALEGFSSVPFENMTAFPLLLEALGDVSPRSVVVAPDFGAMKLADRFAHALNLPTSVVRKQRISGSEVKAQQVVGEVQGRAPIIVDDMISTGGTLEAAARALLSAGCTPHITLVATHGVFTAHALERLSQLPIDRVLVTDSTPCEGAPPFPLKRVSIGPLLVQAVRAMSCGQSLSTVAANS